MMSILLTLKAPFKDRSAHFFWYLLFITMIGGAALYALVNLAFAWQWLNRPFPGILHYNHVVVSSSLAGGDAARAGVQRGDIIQSADGRPLETQNTLPATPQMRYTYLIQKANGLERHIELSVVTFTGSDFIQWAFIPIFMALLILTITTILSYSLTHLAAVRLFIAFVLALVLANISLPEMAPEGWSSFIFFMGLGGAIMMPPFFLHFLLYYFSAKDPLAERPYLLPLIYIPVLPSLVQASTLLSDPLALRTFDQIINIYSAVYMLSGFAWLYYVAWKGAAALYKRAIVLLIGSILPISLLILNGVNATFMSVAALTPAYELADRYIFWSIPIAAAFAIIRYDLFGLNRVSHKRILLTTTVVGLLAIALLLFGATSTTPIGFGRLRLTDYRLILFTVITFYSLRWLYFRGYEWWISRQLSYRLADFRTNVRILSRELLKVRTRRELDTLVSWNLANDFGLQAAEISTRSMPNIHYHLRLPLEVNQVSLGTLYLGPKISGNSFTPKEQEIFSEAQQQIALVLLTLELNQAIRVTEELTRLKSKFLANVTHELRTPLNGIINYIGFVIDDAEQLNEEQLNYLQQALQGAERLLELINNILDMSKIEAGQMSLYFSPVNLTALISDMQPAIQDLVHDKPVNLITQVDPALPIIRGDRIRLRQIILNMLSNAIKFTQHGDVRFAVYPENGDVVIRITDTGPGISEEILPTIFQQFTTNGLTDKSETLGPGLGLPITKSLVELHHGQIDIESNANVGTTVTVNLPVQSSSKRG